MKVPLQWLADHLAELPPLEELTERLSLAGDKVEGVERRGLPAEDGVEQLIVAGHVLEAGKHPNADRLQFCQVDVGEASPRPIVCGAWNFAAGDTVAVALPGTVLLDGRRIASSKLRGETSDGMILSERELDISPDGDGIIVLGDGWRPGEPLAARMALAHDVLELEVTSNRADLLSMRGVARDVHAIFGIDLTPLDDSEPAALGDRLTGDWIKIAIEDEDLCPRFTARVFQDVAIGPSPLWLKARLNAAGMRPISNVVDITNYVMHDLGSPLHAYDHAHIRGARLTARRARAGEKLRTLDGQERELDPSMLVIADAEGPQGVAGIMGGADSEVSESTTTIVLEAVDARDLLDHIDLARDVEEARRRHPHVDRALSGTRIEAEAVEDLDRPSQRDVERGDVRDAVHAHAQMQPRRQVGADVDRARRHVRAAQLHEQTRGGTRGERGLVGVDALLPAIGGLGAQADLL